MDIDLEKRIAELVQEEISIEPYNPHWISLYDEEAKFLREILPSKLVKRIEHFGSTAVPGLSAKPIIDILVEVSSLQETKEQIVPILTARGYEYFWRPTIGDEPPYYAWFIKRDSKRNRSHHIHMVEGDSPLWDRLYFRDYLCEFSEVSKSYDKLKQTLCMLYPHDRIRYTSEKSEFILEVTKKAKERYTK
jgi:GrpB-like predicted nucleotidyltransferase (UPF0157 family)